MSQGREFKYRARRRGATPCPLPYPPKRAASAADGANAYVVVHTGDPEREERYPGIASKGDLQDGLLTPRKARETYGLTDEEIAAALAE